MNLIIVNILIVVYIISSLIYLIQTCLYWYIHNEAIECFCCYQNHSCNKVISLGSCMPDYLLYALEWKRVIQSPLANFIDWNEKSSDKRGTKNTEMKLKGNPNFGGLRGWSLRKGETGGYGQNLNVFSLLLYSPSSNWARPEDRENTDLIIMGDQTNKPSIPTVSQNVYRGYTIVLLPFLIMVDSSFSLTNWDQWTRAFPWWYLEK